MQKKDPSYNPGQLGNLLERYKRVLKPPQQTVIKEVVAVISESMGFTVSLSQFEYKVSSRVVYVRTGSLVKTEILRKKEVLKKALVERLGEGNSPVDFI